MISNGLWDEAKNPNNRSWEGSDGALGGRAFSRYRLKI